MKGQAINIDWTVGMSIFMVAVIAGLFIYLSQGVGVSSVAEKRNKAFLTTEELEEETFIEGRKAPLYVRGPADVGNVPVDTNYSFHENAYAGSGAMDMPADIDIPSGRAVTVTGTGNTAHELSYFFSNRTNVSYTNQVDTGTDWMNNSRVALKTGAPGIQSLRISGNELLNTDAELDGSDHSVTEHELHASTLSGDLKLYNGTRELILESGGTFHLDNLSTLYWYEDNSTTELAGTGTFKNGETTGLTVAGSHGVTFLGDLDATVSKPSGDTVTVEIDSSRTRINLHDSGWETGWKRVRFYDKGDVFFGSEEKLEGASEDKIQNLASASDSSLENRLNLENWGYNLTLGELDRGSRIPFTDVVVSDRAGVILERNGNYSRIEERVAIWR